MEKEWGIGAKNCQKKEEEGGGRWKGGKPAKMSKKLSKMKNTFLDGVHGERMGNRCQKLSKEGGGMGAEVRE
jgi:hypothetical protein